MKEIMIAPKKAGQKPGTSKQGTIWPTNFNISALMIKMKRPSVTRINGRPNKSSRAQRPPTSRKSAGRVPKKSPSSQKAKATMPSEAGTTAEPSDEQIRLRAYFISERRRRFGLPGDAESDWLEAKRQLLSK